MLLHTREPAVAIEGDLPGLQPGIECDTIARTWQRASLRLILLVGDPIERIG
jgi:hypothetical protein